MHGPLGFDKKLLQLSIDGIEEREVTGRRVRTRRKVFEERAEDEGRSRIERLSHRFDLVLWCGGDHLLTKPFPRLCEKLVRLAGLVSHLHILLHPSRIPQGMTRTDEIWPGAIATYEKNPEDSVLVIDDSSCKLIDPGNSHFTIPVGKPPCPETLDSFLNQAADRGWCVLRIKRGHERGFAALPTLPG